jgi:hypothetical protein
MESDAEANARLERLSQMTLGEVRETWPNVLKVYDRA